MDRNNEPHVGIRERIKESVGIVQIESECTRLFKQKLINNQSLVIRIDNTEEVTKKTDFLHFN